MCLDVVYRGKEKKKALAKLPESFYVWKVIDKYKPYKTRYRGMAVHGGKVEFPANMISTGRLSLQGTYRGGGHFWAARQSAKASACSWHTIVRCRAKKSDITSIGTQIRREVIVLKKAVFPAWVGEAG